MIEDKIKKYLKESSKEDVDADTKSLPGYKKQKM